MKKRLIPLLLLVVPALAQATGKDVTYKVDGQAYQGYYTAPNSKNPGLVVLIHDWDGLTDYEKKRADMLRQEGYAVFAADLFGEGVRPTKLEDKKQHTGELYTDRQKMRKLMQAAINTAKQQGGNADNAVVMGYCFGGAAVLELARSGADLRGYITVHGGLGTPQGQSYDQAKGEFLIQHGGADQAVSCDEFLALGKALEAADVGYELISYGGAPHAWTVFGSESYREQADRRAWERQLDFLKEVLAQ